MLERKTDDPAVLSERGNTFLKLGQHSKSVTDFSKAIELQPDNASRWAERAVANVSLAQYEQSTADSAKATALDASNVVHSRFHALLLEYAGKTDENRQVVRRPQGAFLEIPTRHFHTLRRALLEILILHREAKKFDSIKYSSFSARMLVVRHFQQRDKHLAT